MGRKWPPWKWWELSTDSLPHVAVYHVYLYAENGTVTLARYGIASGKVMWKVFGIDPARLVLADSPEVMRSRLTAEELRHYTLAEEFARSMLSASSSKDLRAMVRKES